MSCLYDLLISIIKYDFLIKCFGLCYCSIIKLFPPTSLEF